MSYNSKYTGAEVEALLDASGNKQDKIEDLETIREGASKGATALQSVPAEYVTETELTNKGYATTSALNNKVDKVSGKQLSTEDFTSTLKTKLEGLSNYDDTELSEALSTLRGDFDKLVSGDTTTAIKTFNEVIAFLDGIQDSQDLSSIIASIEQQIAGKMDKVTLATVATSGSYNDLTDQPDFIKGVAINGTTIANTSGTVYLPNASTGGYGITKLNSSTSSTSTLEAATPSAVKAAYDLANGKQDKLTSGTNIKTINGTSILGSGDITISGGSSSSGSGVYTEVNHGTSDTTFTLTPNTFHVWDEVASLTLTLGDETAGVANEFLFQFTSGATATSLTLPDDIKWANDSAPTIAENMIYQVSILKGLASVLEFNNVLEKRENLIDGQFGTYLISAQYPVASDITIEYWDNFYDDTYTVTMLAGTSEVSILKRFGYIENLSPKEDGQFYYLYYN